MTCSSWLLTRAPSGGLSRTAAQRTSCGPTSCRTCRCCRRLRLNSLRNTVVLEATSNRAVYSVKLNIDKLKGTQQRNGDSKLMPSLTALQRAPGCEVWQVSAHQNISLPHGEATECRSHRTLVSSTGSSPYRTPSAAYTVQGLTELGVSAWPCYKSSQPQSGTSVRACPILRSYWPVCLIGAWSLSRSVLSTYSQQRAHVSTQKQTPHLNHEAFFAPESF